MRDKKGTINKPLVVTSVGMDHFLKNLQVKQPWSVFLSVDGWLVDLFQRLRQFTKLLGAILNIIYDGFPSMVRYIRFNLIYRTANLNFRLTILTSFDWLNLY